MQALNVEKRKKRPTKIKQQQSRVSVIPMLLMFLMMAFIFLMSSMPASESSLLSDYVVRILRRLIPVFDQLSGDAYEGAQMVLTWLVRKSAHFFEYFLLGGLALLSFGSFLRRALISLPIAVAVCAGFAMSDEVHQHFVPGRAMTMGDVLIDSCGAILGIILFFLIARPRVIVMDEEQD